MEVILLKDIAKFGKKNEIKNVSVGYARNFLIPNNLAVITTPNLIKQVKHQTNQLNQIAAKKEAIIKRSAEKLKKQKLVIIEKANDDGTLFRGISPEIIAEQVTKKLGLEILPKSILLEKSIKKIGDYRVEIEINGNKEIINIIVNKK